MKEETKRKLKKAGKVCGLVLGFLATFVLGMGFGSCSEKKVQQANAEEPNYGANYNLLDGALSYGNTWFYLNDTPKWQIALDSNGQVTLLLRDLPVGEYLFTYDVVDMWGGVALGNDNFANAIGIVHGQGFPNSSYLDPSYAQKLSDVDFYNVKGAFSFEVVEGSQYNDFAVCGWLHSPATLSLNLLDPANNTPMVLGADWLPYAWVSKRGTGNLGMVANTFTSADVQNTLLRVQIKDVYFYVGDTLICQGVNAYFRPLWNGAKYVNESGEIVTYSYSESNEFVPYVCNYVEYVTLAGTPFRVAEYGVNLSSDGSQVAIVPQLQWKSDVYRALYWLQVPVGDYVVGVDVSTDLGAHWSYWSGTPNYKGITFFDYWRLSVADVGNAGFGSVGDNNVFTLIASGFSSIIPILNIQILPFLTLGTLLLAPLVIILALVILKVLNK